MKLVSSTSFLLTLALGVVTMPTPVFAKDEGKAYDLKGGVNEINNYEGTLGGRANANTKPRNPAVGNLVEEPEPCGALDSMHHEFPCEMNVDSPVINIPGPSSAPASGGNANLPPSFGITTSPPGTGAETSVSNDGEDDNEPDSSTGTGSGSGTDNGTGSSGDSEQPCESNEGTFGLVGGDESTDVSVSYMYEMETQPGTTEAEIDNEILPALEKAVVDSVLSEVFPQTCSNSAIGKRNLRKIVQRMLQVTGITMNPADLINSEFTCGTDSLEDTDNRCDVLDGRLTLYTSDGNTSGEEERVVQLIRSNMNNGVYDGVSPKIVRMQYLDTMPSRPESNLDDGNANNGETNQDPTTNTRELRIGMFVGFTAMAVIIAGVLYRTRRTRHVDDETNTDIQTNNEVVSAVQPQSMKMDGAASESYDSALESGVTESYDNSAADGAAQSYEDSTMLAMADTGMDTETSS